MNPAPALDALTEALAAALAAEKPGQQIAELLGAYAREEEDWRPWALTHPDFYTRNLVARSERFELLILCWGVGQESPIHNHEAQDCWMAVLEGDIEETRYCPPQEVRPGPLEPRDARRYPAGGVAYISDDLGLHLVRSARPEATAVSLHLYAAPYAACDCYCPETGRVERKLLTNHSERGRLLSPST